MKLPQLQIAVKFKEWLEEQAADAAQGKGQPLMVTLKGEGVGGGHTGSRPDQGAETVTIDPSRMPTFMQTLVFPDEPAGDDDEHGLDQPRAQEGHVR